MASAKELDNFTKIAIEKKIRKQIEGTRPFCEKYLEGLLIETAQNGKRVLEVSMRDLPELNDFFFCKRVKQFLYELGIHSRVSSVNNTFVMVW